MGMELGHLCICKLQSLCKGDFVLCAKRVYAVEDPPFDRPQNKSI